MNLSSEVLFQQAGIASSTGQTELAITLLDQCVCSGPTPTLAIQAYYCLFHEILFGMEIAEKQPPLSSEQRQWAARGAECARRVGVVHQSFLKAGMQFDSALDRFIAAADKDVPMIGFFCALHRLDLDSAESLKALESPLKCLSVSWDNLEIFAPDTWEGHTKSNVTFPTFVFVRKQKLVEYSCNPAHLDSSTHNFPDAPHHMTQILFRREVLDFFAAKSSFEVTQSSGEGHICGAGWQLDYFYEDDEDEIMVHLGELGRCAPWEVRKHFREFNVAPPRDGQTI